MIKDPEKIMLVSTLLIAKYMENEELSEEIKNLCRLKALERIFGFKDINAYNQLSYNLHVNLYN